MNPKVIITCAVTGAGDTVGKHPAIPVTPEQIANAALEAADAGAAVVHCHVRNPKTGKGARNVELYAEVVERIRAKNKTVIINLTAGMGGDVEIGPGENPRKFNEANTDLVGPVERLLHVPNCAPKSARSIAARSISATATPSWCRRRRNCANRRNSSSPMASSLRWRFSIPEISGSPSSSPPKA